MEQKENKVIVFVKKEAVLCAALLLALVSSFVVRPTANYITYLDYRVLVLLFCLMLVVAGFKSLGIFQMLGEKLCSKVHSTKGLTLVLVGLCFFASMLITNDVSLITFIPFTLSVYAMVHCEDILIPVIVLETIAANLGSMLTPVGNPQNLLLYSISEMRMGEFILHMLPLTCVSFIIIVVCVCLLPGHQITLRDKKIQNNKGWLNGRFVIYCILFLICLGNVVHLISSYWIVGAIVVVTVLLVNRQLFAQVDYSLLLTFVGFFIFIGNMKHITVINEWLQGIIRGNELLVGIISSQAISNVPAAMLLSGFTTDYKALLYGVNIGGLGTLIASMASLISYRFYVKAYPMQKGKYFKEFTIYNVILLVLLYLVILIK